MLLTVSENGFWLGGTDEPEDGVWEWISGSCQWEFEDWGFFTNVNNTEIQNCLAIGNEWAWNDYNCSSSLGFICQFD